MSDENKLTQGILPNKETLRLFSYKKTFDDTYSIRYNNKDILTIRHKSLNDEIINTFLDSFKDAYCIGYHDCSTTFLNNHT